LELLSSIEDRFTDDLTVSTVVGRMFLRSEAGLSVDREIEFIASHFHEFSSDSLSEICYWNFEQIVSHGSLTLISEDSLSEMIVSRIDDNPSFFGLFEYVRFKYLSGATLSHFNELVSTYFDHLNVSIWRRICARLVHDIHPSTGDPRIKALVFEPNPSSLLEGVIAFLTRKCGGNVHDRGMVTVIGHQRYIDSADCAREECG
jgi:hypothetical protein